MKILAFAASLRKGSFNRKLIRVAADVARGKGADVDLADFQEFDMPLYDGDMEAASGLPQGGLELKRRAEAADALMLSTPEYNHSTPGTLKNAIDWLSRVKPSPLAGKSALLLSASPSPFGGVRGVLATRSPLERLGVIVYGDTFSLPKAQNAFDDGGKLADPQNRELLENVIGSFLEFARRLKNG